MLEKRSPPGRPDRLRAAIIGLLVAWTYTYNLVIKGQSAGQAFFRVLDTISDDFVVGSLYTFLLGTAILLCFTVTKLYTQIITNIYSFRIIEELVYTELRRGRWRSFMTKLITIKEQPLPAHCCPERVGSLLLSFCLIYAMSWVYVVLFSEALFFIPWSAGVDLPITEQNMLLMPTLALAIPFSARVMAYLRYPYAQDYADFMPAGVFVLLIVATLGYLFQSPHQKFFLVQVFETPTFRATFLRNGVLLAFIPLFFEAAFWLLELSRTEADAPEEADEVPSQPVPEAKP